MLIVETIARIRREHFIKGKTIKEIARDLKVSRNTVRKVLRSGETSFEYERQVQPRPKLGRWAVLRRDLPEAFGKRFTVYTRFWRWAEGCLGVGFKALTTIWISNMS